MHLYHHNTFTPSQFSLTERSVVVFFNSVLESASQQQGHILF